MWLSSLSPPIFTRMPSVFLRHHSLQPECHLCQQAMKDARAFCFFDKDGEFWMSHLIFFVCLTAAAAVEGKDANHRERGMVAVVPCLRADTWDPISDGGFARKPLKSFCDSLSIVLSSREPDLSFQTSWAADFCWNVILPIHALCRSFSYHRCLQHGR